MRSLVVALACLGACAAEHRLDMNSRAWTPKVFPDGTYTEREAATLTVSDGVISVGPWLGGKWSARLEYRERIPIFAGTLRFRYRTEDLMPYQAVVRIGFDDGSPISFSLPPSPERREYALPVRRAPKGSKGAAIGVGLQALTQGKVFFSDLVLTDEPFTVDFNTGLPEITRPAPPSTLGRSEFIRLEQHEGTWWFVRPDGTPFFSWGTDGPTFDPAKEMDKGLATLEAMRRMGFNSLAGWTSVTPWSVINRLQGAEKKPPMAMFRAINTAAVSGDYDRLMPGEHAFPDPFDPRWETALRAKFRTTAAPVRNETWFAGWFADNEADHRDLHRKVYTANCSAALRRFLEERHGTIETLNEKWGSKFESFDALIAARPDPQLRTGAMYEDYRAFKRVIVQKYVETLLRVMRQEDPNHLLFSNRFMLGDSSEWLDVIDLYSAFDGIGLNIYPANLKLGLNESERRIYELVHERTGKPVVVPEWSVPALDSGLYDNPQKLDWSYPQTVENQTERAKQAAAVVTDFYNMPFLAGAHWFIWRDIDNSTRQANRGLVKASGEPWVELQEALGAAAARWGR